MPKIRNKRDFHRKIFIIGLKNPFCTAGKKKTYNFPSVKTDRLTSSYTLMYEDKKDAIPEWIAIQKKIRTNRVFYPFPESKTEHRHMESNLWKVVITHVWGRTLVTTPGSNVSIGGKPWQKPDKKVQCASEEDVCCTSFLPILQTALYLLKPLFIENYKQHFINILNNKNYENIIKNLISRG